MLNNEVALVLPEAGALALLEHDGQAARDYARESLAPATRRVYRVGSCHECARQEALFVIFFLTMRLGILRRQRVS